jgi:hypothetical protein
MTRIPTRASSAVRTDRRGQASTIGVVLILAITILGGGVVVVIGADALNDTEQATSLSKAEHSMTQFDSRAAMVALGETRAQRVELGTSGDGEFGATQGEGWIRVVHKNYTTHGDTEEIYNASLGTVTYENGQTTVAYQGGGVWRQRDNGTAMLSPPEFHYRGATLTLPVIRVTTDDSAFGPTDAYVTRTTESRRIYPNESASYGNASAGAYDNPVLNGTVEVTVHSEYYQGWATYFRTRTAGTVSVDHANQTATVELQTVGVVGDFTMADALDDDGLNVRGQSAGHSVNEFTLAFEKDHGTLNNMYFSFYASENGHTYETVIHVPSGTSCNGGGVGAGDTLELYTLYRNETSGATHVWSNESVSALSGPFRLDCGPDGGATIVANLTSDVPQTYDSVSKEPSDDGTFYDWDVGSAAPEARFDHDGVDGESANFTAGDQHTTRNLTRHYFALLGDDFTLSAQTGTGNRGGPQIDVDNSYGTLDYDAGAGGYYITYLHITENEVEVELD